jgi:hypothetical protein
MIQGDIETNSQYGPMKECMNILLLTNAMF